ncbi:hypothetical protein QJS10_CPA10g00869 [Acorus calamus]|uniref:SKA complex subunit 1 homolog n=1 Tax=Acorus calamus TaxID=4465 RepID=A0AAV9E1E8_ACOCL|nr:hypothetical protein QJS10_CPA10g00869 [Acorus calamus]
MDLKQAGTSLDSLISSFNASIVELQELLISRDMFPVSSMADLSAADESQKKLQNMLDRLPPGLHENMVTSTPRPNLPIQEQTSYTTPAVSLRTEEDPVAPAPAPAPKEKKGRSAAPRWYITVEELDSLSSYMRGRLTVDKVNAAINDMAIYADANAQLVEGPKKKVSEDAWERALELRDIAMAESVKGKHFFLETDIKGPVLKLDNTGKAILTVLRHLGRTHEARIGQHRVFILSKPS